MRGMGESSMDGKKVLASKQFVVALIALLLMGCTAAPVYKGVAMPNAAGYALGVGVDDALMVVDVAPGSAAETAGLQVGDTLVSLSWILSEVPDEVPTSQAAATLTSTAPLIATLPPKRPAAGVQSKTVQFTDSDEIKTLTSYGVPLLIHIVRQGRELELTIIPAPLVSTPENTNARERF